MLDLLHHDFVQNALIASILTSLICGIIGALVVTNRMTMLAGGIAHTAYGGIGIAFFFGVPVLPTTLGFSLTSAMLMASLTQRHKHQADVLIGVLWAAGMATGILLLDLTPGYTVDLMSYLFGSILAVQTSDIWAMTALIALLLVILLTSYRLLVAASYDPEFLETRGIRAHWIRYLIIALAAIAIVLIIRIVGLILVIALISIPTYIASQKASSLASLMLRTSLLNILFCFVGLWGATMFNLTSGATIVAVATAAFFLQLIFKKIQRYKSGSNSVT